MLVGAGFGIAGEEFEAVGAMGGGVRPTFILGIAAQIFFRREVSKQLVEQVFDFGLGQKGLLVIAVGNQRQDEDGKRTEKNGIGFLFAQANFKIRQQLIANAAQVIRRKASVTEHPLGENHIAE